MVSITFRRENRALMIIRIVALKIRVIHEPPECFTRAKTNGEAELHPV
jgi:hypothetical protein